MPTRRCPPGGGKAMIPQASAGSSYSTMSNALPPPGQKSRSSRPVSQPCRHRTRSRTTRPCLSSRPMRLVV
eukprot:1253438-Prymnesium_polylepis.1